MTDPLDFIADFTLGDSPEEARREVWRSTIDLVGVGLAGSRTEMSRLIRAHAADQWGGGVPMLFDDRPASASGAALAGGMSIDSLDGHDGYNPAKGHVGCALFPAVLAFAALGGRGATFSEAMIIGYELGSRLGPQLHADVADYHTSGAWMAVAVAGVGARMLGLDRNRTAHALGIAEFHGPRSQMMRVIDHPTMLKDGSGWGAMAGVSAALLARDGFTGAPALTTRGVEWADLGSDWRITAQYMKPWPVCRWAQGPMEAILALKGAHGLTAKDVEGIEIESFHEAKRLAVAEPETTEEAQYSTSFPCALAMARGDVGAADIMEGFRDPEIMRLSRATTVIEHERANEAFPRQRLARATLILRDGRRLRSDWVEPRWSVEDKPSDSDLAAKFESLARPVAGERTEAISEAVETAAADGGLDRLLSTVCRDF